jgi:hypothetical protein
MPYKTKGFVHLQTRRVCTQLEDLQAKLCKQLEDWERQFCKYLQLISNAEHEQEAVE